MKVWICALAVGVAAMGVGCFATRGGYESAPYRVVQKEGAFEVRDYPRLWTVQTGMRSRAGGTKEGDGAFLRLFGYLSGKNAARQKIAMTTPVLFVEGASGAAMAFVLPEQLAKRGPEGLPMPEDASLAIREMAPGRFVSFRFRGGRSDQREREALQRLREWAEARGVRVEGGAVFAYFDPPWTLPFLRRNEVLLRLRDK